MTARDELGLLFVGIIAGLIVATGPGTCVALDAWCEGYADGTGQECTRLSGGGCVCADELVEATP